MKDLNNNQSERNIFFIENYCINYEHSPINAAFLKHAIDFFHDTKITFYAERNHFLAVSELLDEKTLENITFREIEVIRRPFFKSLFQDIKLFGRFFFSNKNNLDKRLVFVNTMSFSNIIVLKLMMLFFKNVDLIIVPHAILNIYAKKSSKLKEIIKYLLLKLFNKKITYLILGESITNEFLKVNTSICNNILTVNHPCIFSKRITQTYPSEKIKIGFLGIGNRIKGIDKFFSIASKLENTHDFIQFHLIGKLSEEFINFKGSNINFLSENKMISKSEMDDKIMEMDYLIFLFNPDDYLLRASGTFIDAVNFLKPIIAIRNNYLSYYFEKFGNIGYLCDSEDEIIEILKNKDLNKSYEKQVSNLITMKKSLEKENIFQLFEDKK